MNRKYTLKTQPAGKDPLQVIAAIPNKKKRADAMETTPSALPELLPIPFRSVKSPDFFIHPVITHHSEAQSFSAHY